MTNPTPDNSEDIKELTCDEYIELIQKQINELKQIRQQFLIHQIDAPSYEEQTMKTLQQLQYGVDGVRHTFLPITIPQGLQLPAQIPKWLPLTSQQIAEYGNYTQLNDSKQKDMLRKFRRPGMRRADIQRAAHILSQQQNKVLEQMEWSRSKFIASIFDSNVRSQIQPSSSVPKDLCESIKSYIDENHLDYPAESSDAELLLISLFDDDGPLASGYQCKTVFQEVSIISTTLCHIIRDFSFEIMTGLIMPYIADLHKTELLKLYSKSVDVINRSLKDARDIYGSDATMEDFGSEGVMSVGVADGLKAIIHAETVDQLVTSFQEIGDIAIQDTNSKIAASNMIAATLISKNLLDVPLYFAYGVAWCSDSALSSFTNQPLYIQAFNAITRIVTDFVI